MRGEHGAVYRPDKAMRREVAEEIAAAIEAEAGGCVTPGPEDTPEDHVAVCEATLQDAARIARQHTTDQEATDPTDYYTTWRYKPWSGGTATVVAATVEFASTHIVWRDHEGSVVLAERPEQVNELAQVGTLGSASRGTRPKETP